jgi:Dyp-type peroxidase family
VARKATALPARAESADPVVDVADVQGLVARSYHGLKEAAYLPIAFDPNDTAAARSWLGEIAGLVTPASRSSSAVEADGHALNLALTYAGLQALGVEARGVADFSREFKEGMAGEHRQRLLGDTGAADPREWKWGGPARPIGAMLFLFTDTPAHVAAMCAHETARAERYRATAGPALASVLLPGDKEHFGFHDGIAQPRIAGLKSDAGTVAKAATIPAGEIILGYANAYGILPMSPVVPDDAVSRSLLSEVAADPLTTRAARTRDLGKNGTYVVFRQLHQDVRVFWDFVDRRAESDPDRRKRLAAKMVGRWPNGAPLVQYPDREPAAFDEETANAFWYRRDLAGDRCPVGSHIRRSNPRDGLMPGRAESLLVADRHRLLRRGRAYGPPLAASFDPADILRAPDAPAAERGLHFICFNTDIGRQFEFVQSTWVNNLKFDGLYADPDPIVAPHVDPAGAHHDEPISRFTIQACPVRERVSGLPRVVTMVGGAYLFMPGLKALRYLASDAA